MSNKSRYLCTLLRHHKNPLGVHTDARGWVNVEELVKRWCEINIKHKDHITVEEVKHMVMMDDKSRFSLSGDLTMIRANQGHTFDIAQDAFTRIVPPSQLFHGTSIHALKSIETSGITKQDRHHVHLSRDAATAYGVGMRHRKQAYLDAVVLGIDVQRMVSDGIAFFISDNGVYLVDHVPFQYVFDIQILRKGKAYHCDVETALHCEQLAEALGHSEADLVNTWIHGTVNKEETELFTKHIQAIRGEA